MASFQNINQLIPQYANSIPCKISFGNSNSIRKPSSLERSPSADITDFSKINTTISNDKIISLKSGVKYENTSRINSDYTMKGNGFDTIVDISMIHEPKVQGTINDRDVELKIKSTSMFNLGKGKLVGTIEGKAIDLKYQVIDNGLNIPTLEIKGNIPSEYRDMLPQLSLLMSDRVDKAVKDDQEIGMAMMATQE